MTHTKTNLGILAYGSLLENPGSELKDNIIDKIKVKTPFKVEYARKSKSRDCAPTLVPDPDNLGSEVDAKILVLQPQLTEQLAKDMLYRREINKVGSSETYDDNRQQINDNKVKIKRKENFKEVSVVLYASLKANIDEILDNSKSDKYKAEYLAELAINSVTRNTFCSMRDGIQYLADAIENGIQTPLTELYKQEILIQTNNSPNLEKARLSIAKKKRIIS